MNEQDKKLLFRYLSMALSYNLIVDRLGGVKPLESCKITKNGTMVVEINDYPYTSKTYLVEEVKPYLRSMEDMTTEEEYEYHQIRKVNSDKSLILMDYSDHLRQLLFPIIVGTETIDWLLKKKFDFMGLIPKGLAIKVTTENNPYKN